MEAVAAAIGSAFLDSAIDLLVKKLDSPQFFTFFKRQKLDESLLEKLKVTLNTLNGLRLADTEPMQLPETTVKNWHSDVANAVYEAEDLLNEIGFQARRSEFNAVAAAGVNSKTGTDQVRNLIKKLNLFNNKKGKKDIVENLGKICDKLELLERKARTLQLMRSAGEIGPPSLPSLPTTSVLELSHVYGRDDVKRNVIESLLSDEATDKNLEVIPIVGRAGIGKTTLAKFVYNDSQVQDWFNLKAWVYVSQKFDVIKLTKDILKAADVLNCDSMTGDQLHRELRKKLMGKKLLLVLDDVWSGDQLTWDFLLAPLKSAAHGSKILLTVRDRSVALSVQSFRTHTLQEISDDDCWLLFSEHAFSGAKIGNAYSQFEERFRGEIARRCNGLPLTARLLGGLLKSKRDAEEWQEILKSNIWDLRHGNNLPVLNVSYYFLPSYLRKCFAYCAIFPKGYLFKKEELVLLWLIEGFLVHCAGYKEMKEEGYKYFHELVSRSFFEQASDHSTYFIMHDLTRELAKFVSGEFSVCLDDDGDSRYNISSRTRHLSYARARIEDLSYLVRIENLRTFLSMSKFFLGGMNNEGIHAWSSRFKHLRVLSLPNVHELPDLIGSLKRLCYLNLSGTSTQRLPESLCTLHDLQILILHGCKDLVELPTKMMKLTNLYHLDIKGARLQKMPPQMGKLTKLQVLTDFFVGRQNGCSIKELGELKCLQGKLHIWNLENVDDARDALGGTRDLKKLDLRRSADTGEQSEQVLAQLQPHAPLVHLSIVGYGGRKFPAWLVDSSVSNIVDLRLSDCNNCSTMPPLGQLASLNKLLIRAFDGVTAVGREFYGRDASAKTPFKSLETLTFEKMPQWREWVPYVEGGAFPRLQVLCIRECPELKKVLPSHLPSLIELKITECPELVLSLPKSPAIKKMTLRDHFRRVELERLPSGLHSLTVDSFCSFDSFLKEMERLGCFPSTLQEMNIDSGLLTCLPLKFFPKLEQLDIRGCRNLESLCAQEEPSCPSTSTTSLKVCECPKLEKLSLFDCSKLKTANCFLPSLVKLVISCCEELEAFPGVGLSSSSEVGFSSKLESLEVRDCKTLFALRKQWDFDKLFSIQDFQVFGLRGS